MKKKLILFIKGLIIGLGKVIPGVSGGMLAISMGVYDKGINAIANFFENPKKHLSFLITIGLGIGAAIIVGSRIIMFFLESFYLPTMLLFIGLISGSLPSVYMKTNFKKNWFFVLIPIVLMILLVMSSALSTERIVNANFISLFLVGSVEAFSMVVPGVSGTAVLMLLGYYDIIMQAYSTVNLKMLIPFLWGTGLFMLILIKIVDYILSNHTEKSYSLIFGFAISSLSVLFFNTLKINYSIINIIAGLFCLLFGYMIAIILDNHNN